MQNFYNRTPGQVGRQMAQYNQPYSSQVFMGQSGMGIGQMFGNHIHMPQQTMVMGHVQNIQGHQTFGATTFVSVSGEIPIDGDVTSFAATSLHKLNTARLNNSHCDFTIKIGNENLPVHKVVLATRSEYFESMFRTNVLEKQRGVVEMRNVDFESVKKCIEYIYTGKASVKEENIEKLMHVAHMMRLKDLCSGICELLERSLNHVTFFLTKRLAYVYNCEDLDQKCDDFALAKFVAVSAQEEFTNLEKDYLMFLLSSKRLAAHESVKLDAIRKWIHKKVDERKTFLPTFVEFVDLSQLPTAYFQSIIEDEPLVYESASMLRKFSLAMAKAAAEKETRVLQRNAQSPLHPFSRIQTPSYW